MRLIPPQHGIPGDQEFPLAYGETRLFGKRLRLALLYPELFMNASEGQIESVP
jgi:hypothetical protein